MQHLVLYLLLAVNILSLWTLVQGQVLWSAIATVVTIALLVLDWAFDLKAQRSQG